MYIYAYICGGAVDWCSALQAEGSRVGFTTGSLEYFIDIIRPATLCLCDRLGFCRKWSTANVIWGKGGRWVGLTTLPLSCADCLEIWESQPTGMLWVYSRPVLGLFYLSLYIHSHCHSPIKYGIIWWGNCSSSGNIFTLHNKSWVLWLEHNPETHVKVCLNNWSLYVFHANIPFH